MTTLVKVEVVNNNSGLTETTGTKMDRYFTLGIIGYSSFKNWSSLSIEHDTEEELLSSIKLIVTEQIKYTSYDVNEEKKLAIAKLREQ